MMSAMRTILATLCVAAALVAATAVHPQAQQASADGFLGRWNLTGTGEDSNAVFWLEVTRDNGGLKGRFLNRGGSPVPLASVKVEGNELVFTTAAPEGRPGRDLQGGGEPDARRNPQARVAVVRRAPGAGRLRLSRREGRMARLRR